MFISVRNKLIPIARQLMTFEEGNSFDTPKFSKEQKEKRGITTSLVTGFIILAYAGISNYLHNKRQTALKKPFIAIENQVNLERNTIFHFEDSMVMYGIYNSEIIEKLINTIHMMHNKTT